MHAPAFLACRTYYDHPECPPISEDFEQYEVSSQERLLRLFSNTSLAFSTPASTHARKASLRGRLYAQAYMYDAERFGDVVPFSMTFDLALTCLSDPYTTQ